MDTSTPIRSEIRRHTLLRMENTSSPLRRSLNSTMNTSAVEIPNDDDQRAHRRSQLQIQKRLSTLATAKPVNLNESFIKEQFIMYTHLFTENKITAKNAWKLQIIDMLRPLCQKSQKDTLQIASTSIDISAKVYGIRVDDLHSEGLKLASNMARASENAGTAENDGEHSEGEQEAAATNKKKKRRKANTGVKSTINKNPNGNLGKLPKLEPTDFTTRVNADTGTIDNLFTNVLIETPNSFVLLDKTKKFIAVSDPIVQNEIMVPLKSFNFPDKVGSINPPFSDFVVDAWDPDQEQKQLEQERSLLSQIQPVVYDDNGFPIPELDGSCNDIFELNDGDMDNDGDVEIVLPNAIDADLRGPIARVVDFTPVDSTIQSSEYSFNPIITTADGKYIDQIWAGPSHWKLKVLRRSAPRFSGQDTNAVKVPQRGKRKHQPEMINLSTDYPDVETMPKLVIKKRPPVVDIDKITLPLMDQSCARIMATIKELMLKAGVCPVEKKDTTVAEPQEDYEVSPYKYENPNDSLYCSHSQPDGDDGDNGDMDDNFVEGHCFHEMGNLAENLVDNPEMVPNTYIQYASKAKQIDMKKLKTAIWHKLTTDKLAQQTENKVIPQTFSELYKTIPDLLPNKEKEKLSCPLAFFALLHLANEQNLYLESMPGNKDCHIMGSEYYTSASKIRTI